MRIIAGALKGRVLSPVKGRTRPTAARVREAIFNILGAAVAEARVLDLFAGTGALGIEALSRGASWCDLVDRDRAACATIRQNLTLAGFQERARVVCLPAERALERLEGPYTLILVDPPYAEEAAIAAVERLAASPLVGPETTLVLEHAWRRLPPDGFGPLELATRRRHGDTGISIYR